MNTSNENMCPQTQLIQYVGEIIKNFSTVLEEDIQFIFNSSNMKDSEGQSEMLKEIIRTAKYNANNVADFYRKFQSDHLNLIQERNNLKEVNSKLLERIHSLNHSKPVASVSVQTDKIRPVEDNVTHSQSQANLNTSNSEIYNSPNKSNLSNINTSINSRMNKVIIYNIDENIGIPDITAAIADKVQEEIPSIEFVKQIKRKSLSKYNYIIKVPQFIAHNLTKTKILNINDCVCQIKQFVHVTRCYTCHQYGHMAKSCKKSKVCGWCGDSHDSVKCDKPPKCTNCVRHNQTGNHSFTTDHPAFASSCSSYKFYILNVRLKSYRRSFDLSSTLNYNSSFLFK